MRFQLQLLYKEITTVVISVISILSTSLNMAIFVYELELELELEQYILKYFFFLDVNITYLFQISGIQILLLHTNLYEKKIKQLHMAGQSLHQSTPSTILFKKIDIPHVDLFSILPISTILFYFINLLIINS